VARASAENARRVFDLKPPAPTTQPAAVNGAERE